MHTEQLQPGSVPNMRMNLTLLGKKKNCRMDFYRMTIEVDPKFVQRMLTTHLNADIKQQAQKNA